MVSLGGDDLVVMLTQVHAIARPSVEVVLHVHAATNALLGANRPVCLLVHVTCSAILHAFLPVLLKGPCSVDGGLVGTGRGGNVVSTTVSLEATLALRSAAGVVGAVRLDHVVLHKRVAGPTVDSQVTVTLRVEGTAVVDGARIRISKRSISDLPGDLPAGSRVPSLATDEVAGVPPGHGVLAALTHGVLSRTATISPPGVEVTVVVALGAGRRLTLLKESSHIAIVALSEEVEGSGEHACGSHSGEKERLEGYHDELSRLICAGCSDDTNCEKQRPYMSSSKWI